MLPEKPKKPRALYQEEKLRRYKETQDLDLKGEIVVENDSLIKYVIRTKFNYPNLYDDLLCEGRIAILNAIDKFEEGRGTFSKLCYIYIRNRLCNYMVSNKVARDSINPLIEHGVDITMKSNNDYIDYADGVERINDELAVLSDVERHLALKHLGFKNYPQFDEPPKTKLFHQALRVSTIRKLIKNLKNSENSVIKDDAANKNEANSQSFDSLNGSLVAAS